MKEDINSIAMHAPPQAIATYDPLMGKYDRAKKRAEKAKKTITHRHKRKRKKNAK